MIDLTGRWPCSSAMKATACRQSWPRQADGAVTIPCPGPVESLNAAVAASVLLLYEGLAPAHAAAAAAIVGSKR